MPPKVAHGEGLADPVLLDKINKLFACGVGERVPLPQLVVLGDQSSGKSSILEGLTSLPFPRDSGLCTRFATQITFRHAPVATISVSVIPSAKADPDHAADLRAWKRPDLKELDASEFAEIMKQVHELMGLGGPKSAGRGGTFSEDVLKLDISGPDEEHYSVVDVPGIFKTTEEGVTTKADIETVRSMVRNYMNNPRSVILAVIPANVDIATQEILEMATEADPSGERTLGVLTKPDLVDEGAEIPVVELLEGKRHTLRLGWCLLKNLGQKDLSSSEEVDRNTLERTYFKGTAPWNGLDSERLGVDALRVRLREILADTIRRTFPIVKQEILKRLDDAKKALGKLGAERISAEQQREYLMDACLIFQRMVRDALSVQYGNDSWFDGGLDRRYATAVVTRNEAFANDVHQWGHSYDFRGEGPKSDEQYVLKERSRESSPEESSESCDQNSTGIEVRMTGSDPDLQEVVFSEVTIEGTVEGGILDWLTTVYKCSRGFELGTFEGSLLATTMKAQSKRWEGLALGYISDIITLTHTFIKSLLEHVCPDRRVRTGIQSALMEGLLRSYHQAYKHVEFLLCVERSGTPATQNHYFNENLQKKRVDRFKRAFADKSIDDCTHGSVVRVQDLEGSHPMANVEHTVCDIKDILESYYKVARKRFVDNVCMQAAGHFLVSESETPLLHFSPRFVNRLSTEQLDEIAGEDGMIKMRRKALLKEIGELEAGRKIVL